MADTQSIAAMKRRIAGIEAELAVLTEVVRGLVAEQDEQRAAAGPAFYNTQPEGTTHGS